MMCHTKKAKFFVPICPCFDICFDAGFIFLNVPADLQLIIRILFMHLFLSFIVNQWIKVSMHTSFNFLFALMMIPTNLYFGIGLMGYGFVNGWSRVQLSRHKPREVIAGLLLGNFTGTLFLYFLKSIE